MRHMIVPVICIIMMATLVGCSSGEETPGTTDVGMRVSDSMSKQEVVSYMQERRTYVPALSAWELGELLDTLEVTGYDTVHWSTNTPFGDKSFEVLRARGFDIVLRLPLYVTDVFDPQDVEQGCEALKSLIQPYTRYPEVIAIAVFWGLFGEGGFPLAEYDMAQGYGVSGYEFTEHALEGFKKYWPSWKEDDFPALSSGKVNDIHYIKWLEYRQIVLKDFRTKYVAAAKSVTDKPVGTWSEVYPVAHYIINMGDAPGADFLLYDCTFGDVTFNQRIAFGETHADAHHYPSFEQYLPNVLPRLAKAVAQGVTPIAFQFPMKRGDGPGPYFVDRVEDEYPVKLFPYIDQLMDVEVEFRPNDVAIVYSSYAAAAYPRDGDDAPYYLWGPVMLEDILYAYGVQHDVIPFERLAEVALDKYKLVIIPDAMYLTKDVYENLQNTTANILFTGEAFRAYYDGKEYVEATPWDGQKDIFGATIAYDKLSKGNIGIVETASSVLVDGIEQLTDFVYPADRYAHYIVLSNDSNVHLKIGDAPFVLTSNGGRFIHLTNRVFGQAYARRVFPELVELASLVLRNVLQYSDVNIHIPEPSSVAMGMCNNILFNQDERDHVARIHDIGIVEDIATVIHNGKTEFQIGIPAGGWSSFSRAPIFIEASYPIAVRVSEFTSDKLTMFVALSNQTKGAMTCILEAELFDGLEEHDAVSVNIMVLQLDGSMWIKDVLLQADRCEVIVPENVVDGAMQVDDGRLMFQGTPFAQCDKVFGIVIEKGTRQEK